MLQIMMLVEIERSQKQVNIVKGGSSPSGRADSLSFQFWKGAKSSLSFQNIRKFEVKRDWTSFLFTKRGHQFQNEKVKRRKKATVANFQLRRRNLRAGKLPLCICTNPEWLECARESRGPRCCPRSSAWCRRLSIFWLARSSRSPGSRCISGQWLLKNSSYCSINRLLLMMSAITSVKVAAGRIQIKVWKIFSRIPAMKSIFVSSDLIISFVFLMMFFKEAIKQRF